MFCRPWPETRYSVVQNMKKLIYRLTLVLIVLAAFSCVACGKKGPLMLPDVNQDACVSCENGEETAAINKKTN